MLKLCRSMRALFGCRATETDSTCCSAPQASIKPKMLCAVAGKSAPLGGLRSGEVADIISMVRAAADLDTQDLSVKLGQPSLLKSAEEVKQV